MNGAGVNAMHQHSIQNTDGIAALVIPLATYNVDHTHLKYIHGGTPLLILGAQLWNFMPVNSILDFFFPFYQKLLNCLSKLFGLQVFNLLENGLGF